MGIDVEKSCINHLQSTIHLRQMRTPSKPVVRKTNFVPRPTLIQSTLSSRTLPQHLFLLDLLHPNYNSKTFLSSIPFKTQGAEIPRK
jgi:hypothetical protein